MSTKCFRSEPLVRLAVLPRKRWPFVKVLLTKLSVSYTSVCRNDACCVSENWEGCANELSLVQSGGLVGKGVCCIGLVTSLLPRSHMKEEGQKQLCSVVSDPHVHISTCTPTSVLYTVITRCKHELHAVHFCFVRESLAFPPWVDRKCQY